MSTQVLLALGSNLGDRLGNLHNALEQLSKIVKVEATSHLYESAPMYVTSQPAFLNAACVVQTSIPPHQLLKECKRIEDTLGREKTMRWGPRQIDVDILFYGKQTVDLPDLIIPHPRIAEREFVLAPLCDIAPNFVHPAFNASIQELYNRLLASSSASSSSSTPSPSASSEGASSSSSAASATECAPLTRVLPLGQSLFRLGSRTLVMGILNCTPDSFSDGGKFFDIEQAITHAKDMVACGADILDIGGLSTKPGSQAVSAEEEADRVVPVIKALKDFVSVPISIDTYRAEVARKAVEAGATIVNDISAGDLDPAMFETVAKLRVPYIMMHMRGTPRDMQSHAHYKNLCAEIVSELSERVNAAQRAGIPKWMVIVDPGIGFAKSAEDGLVLCRNMDAVRVQGCPVLSGPSRKSFIGKLTGKAPADRVWGTAAAVTASILSGADIVRVHDVAEMRDVVRVADAIRSTRDESVAPCQTKDTSCEA